MYLLPPAYVSTALFYYSCPIRFGNGQQPPVPCGSGQAAAPPGCALRRRRPAVKSLSGMPRTALHDAAQANDVARVKALVEEGREHRRRAASAGAALLLHDRATGQHEQRQQQRQELSAASFIEANVQDSLGRTPLHIACAQGCLEVVEALLLKANASANITNKRRRTPLMEAASFGHLHVVEFFLEKRCATVDAQVALATVVDTSGW